MFSLLRGVSLVMVKMYLLIDFPNFTMTSAAKTISWSKMAQSDVYDDLFISRAQMHLDKALKVIKKQYDVTDVIFCPDTKGMMWRLLIYDKYKANRMCGSTSSQLGAGAKLIKDYIKTKYKYIDVGNDLSIEADDILAIFSKILPECVLLSSDRDIQQLTESDKIRVFDMRTLEQKSCSDVSSHVINGDVCDNIPRAKNESELFRNLELVSLDHIPRTIQDIIVGGIQQFIDKHCLDVHIPPYMVPLNVQYGLCCINSALREQGIYCSRKPIFATILSKGLDYLIEQARLNILDLQAMIKENARLNLRVLRISSGLVPHASNKMLLDHFGEDVLERVYGELSCVLRDTGTLARSLSQRLTFHPGQYNVVGTPNESAFEATVRDLDYHATMLDMMYCGRDSVMVVHGGGIYGDKELTKKRWIQQFARLPDKVRRRLVLENCERCFSIQDCLDISDAVNIPVVYDSHHHWVYNQFNEIEDPSYYVSDVLLTWNRRFIKPKFHVSSQGSGKLGHHADYIEEIPVWMLEIDQPIDIMVEAKAKEKAIAALIETGIE